MFLGTLQLFLMFQARLFTEYAAYRAVRAGSVSQGSCDRMRQAALVALLPTFAKTTTPTTLADEFGARKNNKFRPARDEGRNSAIVWIYREEPNQASIPANRDDERWDDPDRANVQRLRARLVFWYPMRIPFANWVIARIASATFGISAYTAQNPLLETQKANWVAETPPSAMPPDVVAQFGALVGSGQYTFPIQSTYAMRMMTPPRWEDFATRDCK
jgi:hypothetical protein